jgi:hypothetical protein
MVTGRGGAPITDPLTGERAADLFVNGFGELLFHPAGGVPARLGRRVPSKVHLLIEPMRRLEDRMHQSGYGTSTLSSLFYTLSDLLIERVPNDNGTPNDPSDDFEELRNPTLTPLTGRLLTILDLPDDDTVRNNSIDDWQREFALSARSENASAVVDLLMTARRAPGTRPLRDLVVHLLTPDLIEPDGPFENLLQLVAAGLQTNARNAALDDIGLFTADLLDPDKHRVDALAVGVHKLLKADRGRVITTLLSNALTEAAPGSGLPPGQSPAEVLSDAFEEVDNAGVPVTQSNAVADLDRALRDVVEFIRDPDGLQYFYDLVRARR